MKQEDNDNIGYANFLLLISLIVLKLFKEVQWSWAIILSPLWAPLALILIAHFIEYLIKITK